MPIQIVELIIIIIIIIIVIIITFIVVFIHVKLIWGFSPVWLLKN